jgi:hypothetical protein
MYVKMLKLVRIRTQWATYRDPNPIKLPEDSVAQYMQYAAAASAPLMFLVGCLLVHLKRMQHYRLLERLYGECEAHIALTDTEMVPNVSTYAASTVIVGSEIHEVRLHVCP